MTHLSNKQERCFLLPVGGLGKPHNNKPSIKRDLSRGKRRGRIRSRRRNRQFDPYCVPENPLGIFIKHFSNNLLLLPFLLLKSPKHTVAATTLAWTDKLKGKVWHPLGGLLSTITTAAALYAYRNDQETERQPNQFTQFVLTFSGRAPSSLPQHSNPIDYYY